MGESGGIGRRARLRGVWGDSYGFKSRLSHQKITDTIWYLLFFYVKYAGEKYVTAVIPLMIASMVRIFVSLESVMNNLVMYPNDREDRILKVSLSCGALNLIMNYLLVFFDILNPSTAMITTGISEIIVFICHDIYARKKMNLNVKIFTKRNLLYLIIGILFIPLSLIIRTFNLSFVVNLCLIVAACIILYFGVLLLTKDNNLIFILSKFKFKIGKGDKK